MAAWLFAVGSAAVVLALRWIPPPASSFIAQGWLSALWAGEGAALRYDWTPMATISPHAALAVIAAEDQRFPDHFGFDLVEIRNALEDQDEGKPLRGASTLSQQVAKNLFLWPGGGLIRKGLEAWFTVLLELLWPKQRILEVYLNIAEFGEYTFGVEAASRRFFHKPAARLTFDEAARLAAVLPNPLRYRVDRPSAYVLKRQRWIERQMRQLGGVAYLDQL
ncbi:MAG: monofunctional biosynthetic peptidoglycan transglycosylase [Candidatus Contendobacter sp.]|nr:monofunctional biosynthetic peptidoglycan transglycosylase [Candidatus Contendobacter sp.]MDG4556303.1 monofunctional biosynthetic peptidoglycan transglycosylase [Candidatus Contendobacter sp.]